jgi:RNA polymerase sigma-70 factor (ECF subfamily)
MTHSELAQKISAGDHSAMQWLFENYYVGLCAYAKKFTKDKEAAEEIVQLTFVKLWKKGKICKFRNPLSPTYIKLYKTTVSIISSTFR